MWPELAPYTGVILWSYGATLGLIGLLVVTSLRDSARTRRRLAELEARLKAQPDG